MGESERAQLVESLSNIANRKGLRFATQPFDFIGSPTWARTRDLRISSRWFGSSCRPRQCSLSGVRTSNTFESFASISTQLEPRTTTGYWKRFGPRLLVVRLCCFVDLGMAAELAASCGRSAGGSAGLCRSCGSHVWKCVGGFAL